MNAALHQNTTASHRFHFLDALRGVAALLVVLRHAPSFLLHFPENSAFILLDFFFCLSGFVIAFSYEDSLSHQLSINDFMAARFIRLYPTFLLANTFGLISCVAFHMYPWISTSAKVGMWAFNFFMVPNYFLQYMPGIYPLVTPAWSLFFEVILNLLFALLLKARLAGSGYLAFIGGCALLFLSLHAANLNGGFLPNRLSLAIGLARVSLSFPVGVLSFRLYRRMRAPSAPPHLHGGIAMAVLATLLLVSFCPAPFFLMPAVQLTAVTLIFPLMVLVGSGISLRAPWIPVCNFLCDMSYPVYLLHIACLYWAWMPSVRQYLISHPRIAPVAGGGSVTVTILLSYLVLRFYERPVRRMLTSRYKTRNLAMQPVSPAAGIA